MKRFWVSGFLLFLHTLSFEPSVLEAQANTLPQSMGWVNDFAEILDQQTESQLQSLLDELEKDTSAEVVVVTLNHSGNRSPKGFATELFNYWKVGKKDKNNGLMILLSMQERRLETEVGIGFEKLLTNARTSEILQEMAVPYMRQGQPGKALLAATQEFALLIRNSTGSNIPGQASSQAERLLAEKEDTALPAEADPSLPQPTPIPSPPKDTHSAIEGPSTGSLILLFAMEGPLLLFLFSYLPRQKFPDSAFAMATIAAILIPLIFWFFGFLTTSWLLTAPGMLLASLGASGSISQHRCPQCQKWQDITRTTLQTPTYTSTGLEKRTHHCKHCGHHMEKNVTLPRKTRSSSRSSGSSKGSGSGGSFGGGRSRGGGGGASW